MDTARRWTLLLLLLGVTWDWGVFGRAVKTRGLLSKAADERSGSTLRAAARRWRRADAETHRDRCAELVAPWQENPHPVPQRNATLLELRVRPFSPGASRDPVFPGKPLFGFVRRVYRCCREGRLCRRVKGIQGHRSGDTVDFLLTREVLSLMVTRAELHFHLSNPHHLDVRPVLPALWKRDIPTRYTWGSPGGDTVELRVDLLRPLQTLQEAAGGSLGPADIRQVVSSALRDAGGAPWGPVLELRLVLGCSRAGSGVSCGASGVRLSHPPFMALYYR